MAARGRGLGKGLDTLIPQTPMAAAKIAEAADKEGVTTVKITKVEPNPDQPRKVFEESALQELAESIKEHGVLQPLLVVDRKKYYEIVAGERRWRAAQIAGLKEVPVIIRDLTDQEIVEIALIENIQREDLNPIEEAQAYKRLLEEFHLKQEEVAERVSKSRTAVTNSMRLLKLAQAVQDMVVAGSLTTGHARALLAIEDEDKQVATAEEIIEKKLSVRDVEKLVKDLAKPKKEKTNQKDDNKAMNYIYQEIEEEMKSALGTKVTITAKDNGAGKIEIEFFSNEELDRIREIIK